MHAYACLLTAVHDHCTTMLLLSMMLLQGLACTVEQQDIISSLHSIPMVLLDRLSIRNALLACVPVYVHISTETTG